MLTLPECVSASRVRSPWANRAVATMIGRSISVALTVAAAVLANLPPSHANSPGTKESRAAEPSGPAAKAAPKADLSPARPFVGRGRELTNQGKYPEAIAEFDKAVAADPKYPWGYAFRGQVNNRIGRFAEAVADGDRALQIDPRNVFALLVRGFGHRFTNDYGRAFADFNAAMEINPSDPGPHAFRGGVYTDTGDLERALKDLNTAIQLDPKYAAAYTSLGVIYNRQRQFEKAIETFDSAIKYRPHASGDYLGRGFAYLNLGENERALVDLNEAVRLNPRDVGALVNRGRIFVEKGEAEPAIKDLNEGLQLSPKRVDALMYRARAYEISGNLSAARSDFANALSIAPSHRVAIAGIERLDNKIAAASGAAKPAKNRSLSRVALVVGNSRYSAIDNLANPERDANLVADTFKRLGFDKVQLLLDGGRDQISDALKAFAQDAANADWGVVYYAGHGIEFDGSNYLVPVDAKYEEDANIPNESVALDQILNAVGAASKLRLVILDACRENPLVSAMKKADASSIGRGLARIEPESGTLVAFATKHGKLASDGAGQNSPFATALVSRMQTPGLEVSQLFRLVHDEVVAATDKQQEPFTYGQLPAQQFYFKAP